MGTATLARLIDPGPPSAFPPKPLDNDVGNNGDDDDMITTKAIAMMTRAIYLLLGACMLRGVGGILARTFRPFILILVILVAVSLSGLDSKSQMFHVPPFLYCSYPSISGTNITVERKIQGCLSGNPVAIASRPDQDTSKSPSVRGAAWIEKKVSG